MIENKFMTKEDILEINEKCPDNQGIFYQPSMIPVDIKEHVIYSRYETGGVTGGSCWGGNQYRYEEDVPKDRFQVLDLVLAKLKPNITYLQYKKIEAMVHTNKETKWEYYGNSSDWHVEYIILSELEDYLKTII